MKLLDAVQWDILTLIEEEHLRTGTFPDLSLIKRKTGYTQEIIVEKISDPLMKQCLDRRGINYLDVDRLTGEQIACINLLLNVSDRRSQTAKLKALGIPPVTFQNWKRQKYFMDSFKQAGEKLFGECQPEVNKALVEQATAGDMKAIEYLNKLTNYYDPKNADAFNVQLIMVRLLETIQKHVRDPHQLTAIAEEFESIMNKNTVRGEISA